MTGCYFYRRSNTTLKGGPNWWPNNCPEVRFSQVIYHNGLVAGEVFVREGMDKWRWGQKALDLMELIIRLFTCAGDRVFDGFAGTGTTLLACARNGRFFIGCDRDSELLAKVVKPRLEQYLDGKAISTLLTPEVIKEHRLVYAEARLYAP